jgi:hypothetical protein
MLATNKHRFLELAGMSLLILSGLPFVRMTYQILSQTTNCFGTDYDFIVPAVVAYLDPTLSLIDRINACCFGPHCFLQQITLHALIATTSEWDSHTELILGLLLAVIRLPLMIATLSPGKPVLRLISAAVIMALTFGTASTSSFICGQPSLSTGVVLFWFCLACYGAAKYTKPLLHSLLYFVSGVFAGITGAYLLLPIGIVGLICAYIKRSKTLLALTLTTGLCGGLILLWVKSLSSHDSEATALALRPEIFIQILGRPFYDHLGNDAASNPHCAMVGLTGLVAFVALLVLRLRHSKTELPMGAYSYVLFGLTMTFLISCTRASIAPWYAPFAAFFWLGLCSSALEFCKTLNHVKAKVLGTLIIAGASICYLTSNISFRDKDFYQHTHGPVSESVLRNYEIAPTYGENYICASRLGTEAYKQKIAAPLSQNNWSTFGTRQRWDLQGDFYLPTVTVTPPNSYKWVDQGKRLTAKEWKLSEKLNLLLPANTELDWQLSLPPETISAEFDSVLTAASSSSPISKLKIKVRLNNKTLTTTDYLTDGDTLEPIKVDLTPFKGQTIALSISTCGATTDSILKRPHINLFKQKNTTKNNNIAIVPCNTELSPYFGEPVSTEEIQSFSGTHWQAEGLKSELIDKETLAITFSKSGARLNHIGALNIPVSALKEIVFGIAADTSLEYQNCALQFTTDKSRVVTEQIPILKDANWHQYSLPTKATRLKPDERIVGITFFPYFMQDHANFKLSVFKLRYH